MKSYGDSWYVWHRDWGTRATYTRMPDELEIVYKNNDGHETIKMVLCKHGYDDCEQVKTNIFWMRLKMTWIGDTELVILKAKRMRARRMKATMRVVGLFL